MKKLKGFIDKYKNIPLPLKASMWFAICNVVQKAMAVITMPIITRMLNTFEYGTYSVFVSYNNILLIFGTLNVYDNGYYVGMKRYSSDKFRYTSSMAGLMLLLTTGLFLIFIIFRAPMTLHTGVTLPVWLLMFIWVYGQSMIGLWFTENRYEYKYRLIVASTLFIAVLTPFLKMVLIMFFNSNGIDKSLGAILGLDIPVAVVGLLSLFFMMAKGKALFVKEYWKFAITFNIPLIPYYLSQTVLSQADKIMIERIDSASSAGIYSVAYSLAMTITIINYAINSSFTPWQFQNMSKGNCKTVAKATNIVMLLLATANLMLIFIAPEIMKIFAAKEYIQAIYVIPPVTIGVLIMWLTQIFINVEFYFERNRIIAISSVLSAVLNISLNAIAIPKFGFLAAGYTTLICYLANMIFHGFASIRLLKKNHMDSPFEIWNVIVLTIACICIMLFAIFMYKYVFVRYAVLAVTCFVVIANYRKIRGIFGEILKAKK